MRSSANRMLGIIVGVVAALAIGVAVLTAAQSPKALDPTSPDGVVQQYLTAVIEHRNDDASRWLDPKGSCDAADLDRFGVADDVRVNLVQTWSEGDAARVTINLEYGTGDLFGGGWSEQKTLRLSRADGQWRIVGVPWPMYDCNPVTVKS